MRRHGIILTILLVVGLITLAGAGDGPADRPADTSAMMAEIETVLAGQDAAVAALQARLQAAADEREALVLLREIDACKRDAELAVLGIQRTYALRAGDAEAAARIAAAIETMTKPVAARPNPEVEKARREREAGGGGHE